MENNYCAIVSGLQKIRESKLCKAIRGGLFFVMICITQAFASDSYAQSTRLSLNIENQPLQKILEVIEEQTEFRFMYDATVVDVHQRKSIQCKDQPVTKILDDIFKDSGISYKIDDRQIALSRSEIRSSYQQTSQQQRTVTGTVTDQRGEPLPGATVVIKGTTQGTVTNADGNYSLSNVPGDATLVFSFVGMETQEINVGNRTKIDVTMQEEAVALQEVVAVGYGTMRKKDLTGSVIQIKPDKIANEAPRTIEDVLRGTPGLNVGLSNTAKGNTSLQIRGQRSLYTEGGHNDPLIVLDGMIFYGELSEINPIDIGQIDILKDASSAAIYGAKAANGVIIITTKKGLQGKPVINFTSNIGLVNMGVNRKIYDAEGYLQFRQDWFDSKTNFKYTGMYANPTSENLDKYGLTMEEWRAYAPSSSSDTENWLGRLGLFPQERENYLSGKTFDWYKHSFQTGLNHNHNISLSGASDMMNYYMSVGYIDNDGIIVGDNYQAVRVNLKLDGKVNKWLNIGANVNFQDRSSEGAVVNWGAQIRSNSPYALPVDDEGNLVYQPMGANGLNGGYNFDFEKQFMERESGATILNSIFTAKVSLPFNITYSFNISPRYSFSYSRSFDSSEHPAWKTLHNGLVDRSQGKNFDWSLNNTINWDYTFKQKHRFNVTLTQEAEEFRSWSDEINARDFQPTDALGFHNTGYANKSKSSFGSSDSHSTADALLARLFYSYDERYMLTASVRRDGYSAFGISNPHATFPALALAWAFTNEKFWQWDPMSMGKMRISWGKNGNRSLADVYMALSNLTPLYADGTYKTQGYINPSTGELVEYQQLVVDRLANPYLQWEKTSSWNVGLDFGFFNNRLMGNIDYYSMTTHDMIMWQTIPNFTGFSSIISNLGEIQNKGLEINLNTSNIKASNFEWNTSFGFSLNRNKIKHLYYEYEDIIDDEGNVIGSKEMDVITNGWFIGQPIDVIWDYKLMGIWQENEAEEAAKYGQRPGDPKVQNSYKPEEYSYTNEDKKFLGKRSPDFQWSMRNDFTLWKDINLSFNIYSKWGHKGTSTEYYNDMGYTSEWYNSFVREYWTPDNTTNEYARLASIRPKNAESTPKIIDMSFIRLENISLAYFLPKKISSHLGVGKIKVYGTIRNVAVWTKEWEYWDPEISGPVPRTFTFGFNLTF